MCGVRTVLSYHLPLVAVAVKHSEVGVRGAFDIDIRGTCVFIL